jgi:hypothetical protein
MILASHGIIASQIASFDADAVAFFDRVTTAGGTLSTTEKQAVNQLVLDLKANSLWTPMKAIYPMVGASAAACAQNLKSSSFTGTFTSGWTFASTGVTPNGTSAYMDTGLNSNILNVTNTSFSLYLRTVGTVGTYPSDIGVVSAGARYFINYMSTDSNSYFDIYNRSSFANSNVGAGFIQYTRTSNSLSKVIYKNSFTHTNTNSTNSYPNPNDLIYLGACKILLSARDYSNRQNSFCHIGDGLTDTQASNLYTAVQAFQTTLSRQV